MSKEKKLLLFTYTFPYGTSETFLEAEIILLAAHYEKIAIVPMEKLSVIGRPLPANVEIIDVAGIYNKNYPKNIIKNFRLILQIFFTQLFNSKRKSIYLKQFRYYLSFINHKINVANKLYSVFSKKNYQDATYYSYWFDYLMLPLSILRKEKKINYLLSRAHGGDVYEYQHYEPDFYFVFRSFQVKHTDVICPISLDGLNHLKTHYPLSKNKLILSRLGVNAVNNLNLSSQNELVIVSCSTFFSYKRVHLIPEILKHLTIPVKWIHIGDEGNLKHETLDLIKDLPKNVEVVLKGQLSNKAVISFYETTAVSIFLNVSLSEGLPVSIMEAISFGIPVIATDVGGVKEIVNEKTGNLLRVNFDPKEVASLIEANLPRYGDVEFRKGVRLFWENNFNATKNYTDFIENVLPA